MVEFDALADSSPAFHGLEQVLVRSEQLIAEETEALLKHDVA